MLWILLLLPWILGASWYVDNAVTSSGAGTSWAVAWKNFSNINWTSVAAGDTIYLSGGRSAKVYTETLTVGKSGTSGAPITIRPGYEFPHNGTVVIDGQLTRDTGVNVDSFNFITLDTLTLIRHIGEQGAFRIFNTDNVLVQNSSIEVAGHGAVFFQNNTNYTFRNNSITTVANTVLQTDAIYSQLNDGGGLFENNSIVITNEDLDGHNDCIQARLDSDTVIRNNFCWQKSTKTGNCQGFWLTEDSGTWLVYNNIIYAPVCEITLIGFDTTGGSPSATIHIWNNTLMGGRFANIWFQAVPSTATIKNNIIHSTNAYAAVRLLNSTPAAGNIDYNLYYTPNKTDPFWDEDLDVHYTLSGWQALGYDTHSIGLLTDPLLVAPTTGNFRLQATSPAINVGVTLPLVTTGQAGVPRPQPPAGAYDMGAYEFGGPGAIGANEMIGK